MRILVRNAINLDTEFSSGTWRYGVDGVPGTAEHAVGLRTEQREELPGFPSVGYVPPGVKDGPYLLLRRSVPHPGRIGYAMLVQLDPGPEAWDRFRWNPALLLERLLRTEDGQASEIMEILQPTCLKAQWKAGTIQALEHLIAELPPEAPFSAVEEDLADLWLGTWAEVAKSPIKTVKRTTLEALASTLESLPLDIRQGVGWLREADHHLAGRYGLQLVLNAQAEAHVPQGWSKAWNFLNLKAGQSLAEGAAEWLRLLKAHPILMAEPLRRDEDAEEAFQAFQKVSSPAPEGPIDRNLEAALIQASQLEPLGEKATNWLLGRHVVPSDPSQRFHQKACEAFLNGHPEAYAEPWAEQIIPGTDRWARAAEHYKDMPEQDRPVLALHILKTFQVEKLPNESAEEFLKAILGPPRPISKDLKTSEWIHARQDLTYGDLVGEEMVRSAHLSETHTKLYLDLVLDPGGPYWVGHGMNVGNAADLVNNMMELAQRKDPSAKVWLDTAARSLLRNHLGISAKMRIAQLIQGGWEPLCALIEVAKGGHSNFSVSLDEQHLLQLEAVDLLRATTGHLPPLDLQALERLVGPFSDSLIKALTGIPISLPINGVVAWMRDCRQKGIPRLERDMEVFLDLLLTEKSASLLEIKADSFLSQALERALLKRLPSQPIQCASVYAELDDPALLILQTLEPGPLSALVKALSADPRAKDRLNSVASHELRSRISMNAKACLRGLAPWRHLDHLIAILEGQSRTSDAPAPAELTFLREECIALLQGAPLQAFDLNTLADFLGPIGPSIRLALEKAEVTMTRQEGVTWLQASHKLHLERFHTDLQTLLRDLTSEDSNAEMILEPFKEDPELSSLVSKEVQYRLETSPAEWIDLYLAWGDPALEIFSHSRNPDRLVDLIWVRPMARPLLATLAVHPMRERLSIRSKLQIPGDIPGWEGLAILAAFLSGAPFLKSPSLPLPLPVEAGDLFRVHSDLAIPLDLQGLLGIFNLAAIRENLLSLRTPRIWTGQLIPAWIEGWINLGEESRARNEIRQLLAHRGLVHVIPGEEPWLSIPFLDQELRSLWIEKLGQTGRIPTCPWLRGKISDGTLQTEFRTALSPDQPDMGAYIDWLKGDLKCGEERLFTDLGEIQDRGIWDRLIQEPDLEPLATSFLQRRLGSDIHSLESCIERDCLPPWEGVPSPDIVPMLMNLLKRKGVFNLPLTAWLESLEKVPEKRSLVPPDIRNNLAVRLSDSLREKPKILGIPLPLFLQWSKNRPRLSAWERWEDFRQLLGNGLRGWKPPAWHFPVPPCAGEEFLNYLTELRLPMTCNQERMDRFMQEIDQWVPARDSGRAELARLLWFGGLGPQPAELVSANDLLRHSVGELLRTPLRKRSLKTQALAKMRTLLLQPGEEHGLDCFWRQSEVFVRRNLVILLARDRPLLNQFLLGLNPNEIKTVDRTLLDRDVLRWAYLAITGQRPHCKPSENS